jgi:hypothetical protein
MGTGRSTLVPTTKACIIPTPRLTSKTRIYFLSLDDVRSLRECADVRTFIPRFVPIGSLVQPKRAATATPQNVKTTTSYQYTWPKPRDETLASLWEHTTHTLKVTSTPGPSETHVYGERVVSLDQMLGAWYPVPLSVAEATRDSKQFAWHQTKLDLKKRLTEKKWLRWRDTHRDSKFATWESTLDAIIAHYQSVMLDAICEASLKCTLKSDFGLVSGRKRFRGR